MGKQFLCGTSLPKCSVETNHLKVTPIGLRGSYIKQVSIGTSTAKSTFDTFHWSITE